MEVGIEIALEDGMAWHRLSNNCPKREKRW